MIHRPSVVHLNTTQTPPTSRRIRYTTDSKQLSYKHCSHVSIPDTIQLRCPSVHLARVPSAYLRQLTEEGMLIPRHTIQLCALVGQGCDFVCMCSTMDILLFYFRRVWCCVSGYSQWLGRKLHGECGSQNIERSHFVKIVQSHL